MNTEDDLAPIWDALLDDGLVEAPDDFHSRVMQRVQQDARESVAVPSVMGRVANTLQAAAVLIGALAAGWQTLSFILGLWATSLAI